MKIYEVVVIGGGPAGLAAAVSAKENGISDILIIERDKELGGILNQCIHNGFGLHAFKEELTGPEYADRFVDRVKELDIKFKLNTMVMDISKDKMITAMNKEDGMMSFQARTVILAMGCRERPRGALNIPGYRPAGIFSAGTAQKLVNTQGYLPGREVVILGSGDIGLIMARRMTVEGANIKLVAELMPYSGGLKRNIVQCLDDYGIPLKLSHTIVDIKGKERLEGVVLAAVDEKGKVIDGTEEYYSCDTLLLSVGLLPENELSEGIGVNLSEITGGPIVNERLETNIEGVFACGNVLHVHDLVDYVSEEAKNAGKNAAEYVKNIVRDEGKEDNISKDERPSHKIILNPANGVRYTVPSTINLYQMDEKLTVRFRVERVYKNCYISTFLDDKRLTHKKKLIMAPGEMEEVVLEKEKLLGQKNLKTITIKIEEE